MDCGAAAHPEKCEACDSARFALILHLLSNLDNTRIFTAAHANLKVIHDI